MSGADADPRGTPRLEDAYSVETPEDNRRLYARWAGTYETSFIGETGYVYHRRVAEIFAAGYSRPDEPVLDVGCGTGIGGVELRSLGVRNVDGIDISPEMLAQARSKSDPEGSVYRRLIEADLTGQTNIPTDTYSGIVSAGTFTHGHLGPSALHELVRVAASGARCVIGVNSAHFEELDFSRHFEDLRSSDAIGPFDLVDATIYQDADDVDPDNVAKVVVFAVV